MKLSTFLALFIAGAAVAAPGKAIKARDQIDGAAPHIDDYNFIGRIMDAHWYWRRIHCAQDLKWDPALAQAALDSVSACTDMPQHVSHSHMYVKYLLTNLQRIAVAAIFLHVVQLPPTTTSGLSSPALSFTVGTRRRPSTRTTIPATRMPGATSLSWSGGTALALAALWHTAGMMATGRAASIAVSEPYVSLLPSTLIFLSLRERRQQRRCGRIRQERLGSALR